MNFGAILLKSHKDKIFFESPEPGCLCNFRRLGSYIGAVVILNKRRAY